MSRLLTRLFSNKSISLLAVIFIAVEAVPVIGTNPNPIIFTKVALWLFGSIFVWLNKDWAAFYLAGLAMIYFVLDIVLPIPKLVDGLNSLSSQPASPSPYVPYIILLSMLIEIVFLLCFIYYGVVIFRKKVEKK
jgi:hypothetical protein